MPMNMFDIRKKTICKNLQKKNITEFFNMSVNEHDLVNYNKLLDCYQQITPEKFPGFPTMNHIHS